MSPEGSGGAERATGVVADFDEERGIGEIEDEQGKRVFFHCVAIADGTRTIPTGTNVTYAVRAGHLGRWEAADIRPRG